MWRVGWTATAREFHGQGNEELGVADAEVLFRTNGPDLSALARVADEVRARNVGQEVTYVRNRNINFTNVCVKRCGFCAFSRTGIDQEGYFLPLEEILRRAGEAQALGATEVCIQAGLPPDMDGSLYPTIARALKSEYPSLHIHAFSPEEVLWGARRSHCSVEEYLLQLKEAGVGSLPGTSAEILDDDLRHQVAKGRLSVAQWVQVISTAHRLGLPTTATMMFGFCESPKHLASHLVLLRSLQKRAQEAGQRGFTEFVPLGFVASEAPMWKETRAGVRVRPGPTGAEVLRAHAVARLVLNPALPGGIENLQVSWVKEGFRMAQLMLHAGANDLGGTLMNESISTAAGAQHGQLAKPSELRRLVWELGGRSVAERYTTYEIARRFESPASDSWEDLDEAEARAETSRDAPAESLEKISDSTATFGSFHKMISSSDYRFRDRRPSDGRTAFRQAGGSLPKAPGSGAQRFFASPRAAGRVVTYSPSYTMIPSYECFNTCTYCNFRSPVTKEGRDWMSDEVARQRLDAPSLRAAGVDEILVMAGEVHPKAPNRAAWVSRAESICSLALECGFLPHTNIGPLSRDEMARLRAVNASMGLMLEQAASLSVHRFAPSKQPSVRLEQLRQAGELRVPFTTGLLIGVGEDASQRLHSLELLAQLAEEFWHIQEVILQPHSLGTSQRLQPETQSQESPKALFGREALDALPDLVTEARKMLPQEVQIQVPPNLFLHGSFSKAGCFKGVLTLGSKKKKAEQTKMLFQEDGDVLIMAGDFQAEFQHGVPPRSEWDSLMQNPMFTAMEAWEKAGVMREIDYHQNAPPGVKHEIP
ncbi:cofH [Symbiodinium sp. CCMP2592]|nr:cofH [Symbiodinium sp. CCMP2592]